MLLGKLGSTVIVPLRVSVMAWGLSAGLAEERFLHEVSKFCCRSVDVISRKPGHGSPTTDFEAFFASFNQNCSYETP